MIIECAWCGGEMKDERMKCPMFKNGVRCPGDLQKVSDGQTYLGIMNGVDDNRVKEVFKCQTCGAVVERSWHWELRGGSRDH